MYKQLTHFRLVGYVVLTWFFFSSYTAPLYALTNNEAQLLFATDGAADDYYGYNVDIEGDTAVIGAPYDDDLGSRSGSVYVYGFDGNNWVLQSKLLAPDGAANDFFGWSVSLSGDTLLVGAWGDDDKGATSGSAYVFTRSNGSWSLQSKLLVASGAADDRFGFSVSLSVDTAVIGSYGDDDKGSFSGSAAVFVRSNGVWAPQQKLLASDGAAGDYFGFNVSISGDSIAVGSYRDSDHGTYSGSVYLFTRVGNTWSQQVKLVPADGQAGDLFGVNLSLANSPVAGQKILAVGASSVDDKDVNAGAVYVYIESSGSWSQEAKLLASDGASGDIFGRGVAIDGGTLLVGAYSHDAGGVDSGAAYYYTRSSSGLWTEQRKFVNSTPVSGAGLGFGVALSQGNSLVGAYADTGNTALSGTASIFFPDRDNDGIADAKDADTDGDGIPDAIETGVGLDPLDGADGSADLDNDGWSNADEYRFGSNPTGVYATPDTLINRFSKAFAADGEASDRFAQSIVIDGDTAIMGAPGDDDRGNAAGAAYVFQRLNGVWTQQAKLLAVDGASGDGFGVSVVLSGNTAVIGATGDDDNGDGAGAAYIFTRTGEVWTQQQKLLASDGAAGDNFGYSLAIDGTSIVVTANLDDDMGADSGSAYVFSNTGAAWQEQAKLLASDGVANDRFGVSAVIDGTTIMIGAALPTTQYTVGNPGSVYVYERNGVSWSEQQILEEISANQFGASLSLIGDTVLIGAYLDDNGNGVDAGSAFIYRRVAGTWLFDGYLKAVTGSPRINDPNDLAEDNFGRHVALLDEFTAVISAPNAGYSTSFLGFDTPAVGAVYVFTRNRFPDSSGLPRWNQAYVLDSVEAGYNPDQGKLGAGISASGSTVMAMDRDNSDIAAQAGIAYFYDLYFDLDNDGIEDKFDEDIDGDGIANQLEVAAGLDTHNYDDALLDLDGDGWSNQDEARFATLLDDPASNPASAQNAHSRLFAKDSRTAPYFSGSVAIDGEIAVIGSPQDASTGTGAVYVYANSGSMWTLLTILRPEDGEVGDFFGKSVAVSEIDRAGIFNNSSEIERTILVGAYGDDDKGSQSGSVYVYTGLFDTWNLQTKLTAADGAADDLFGYSLAVSADTAVIGAYGDDDLGSYSGSAYVFTRSAGVWTQQSKLLASDGASADFFGFSLALQGNTLVVGAYGDDDKGSQSGSAYVFDYLNGAWTQQAKLLASDGASNDYFARSVALDNDTILVGAYGDDDNGSNAGAAYLFTRNAGTGNWSQSLKLLPQDGAGSASFGYAVALANDFALVGAYGDNAYTGAAYVFARNAAAWPQALKLTANDGVSGDNMGFAVAISNYHVLSGAPNNDALGNNTGFAYLFDELPVDLDSDGVFDQYDDDIDGDDILNVDETTAGLDPRNGSDATPDIDNDGIANALDNCIAVANASQLDTDGDGLGDQCDPDDDNDWLNDLQEAALGTNPLLNDTDNDGLSDYFEVNAGLNLDYEPGLDSDPLNPDTDGDGLLDGYDPLRLVVPDGDLAPRNAPDGVINAADLLIARRILDGDFNGNSLPELGTTMLGHGDLYPPGAPDGVFDLSDYILLQKMVLP